MVCFEIFIDNCNFFMSSPSGFFTSYFCAIRINGVSVCKFTNGRSSLSDIRREMREDCVSQNFPRFIKFRRATRARICKFTGLSVFEEERHALYDYSGDIRKFLYQQVQM